MEFKAEIRRFHHKLLAGEKFALSRFGDGEWAAINRMPSPGFNEWTTWTDNDEYERARQQLTDALQYQDPNYYVGISCTCCLLHIRRLHQKFRKLSQQPESNLTFANVFVNGNFDYFHATMAPDFSRFQIVVVANASSKIEGLPFPIKKFYPIPNNAWVQADTYIEQIAKDQHTNTVMLFSGGAFASIAVQQLWAQNRTNTYLDIGSTLDYWLKPDRQHRIYFYDDTHRQHICQWS